MNHLKNKTIVSMGLVAVVIVLVVLVVAVVHHRSAAPVSNG